MSKLHLGCGEKKINGFINVDVLETSATDLICDLKDLKRHFENGSVEYIYACHILEHLSRHTYLKTFADLFEILQPGGMLRVSVPDFEAIAEYYYATRDLKEVRGTLFGGQINQFDYHCWTWDYQSLLKDLESVGFVKIKRYDPFQVQAFHSNVRDWSLDFVPRHDLEGKILPDEIWFQGKLVSLNVEAIKPGCDE